MTPDLTMASALLLGLAASGHCVVMCGGITAALGLATAKNAVGRPRTSLLLAYQLGRITSYTVAGLLFGTVFGFAIQLLGTPGVREALRTITALTLLLAGLVALGRLRDPGVKLGRALWPRLAPLGRRLFPVSNVPCAAALGMIWGWMPCGFVYTVLLIATLQGDAPHGAGVMAAFGAGTLPALFAMSFGAQSVGRWTRPAAVKYVAGGFLLLCAALTFASPWLLESMPALHRWLPFHCHASV